MNILKARCSCGSRATIIRTDPVDKDTVILTARCDDARCQRIFQAMLTFYQEIAPPIANPDHQLSFWEYTQ